MVIALRTIDEELERKCCFAGAGGTFNEVETIAAEAAAQNIIQTGYPAGAPVRIWLELPVHHTLHSLGSMTELYTDDGTKPSA
jgi:hypothetical protein